MVKFYSLIVKEDKNIGVICLDSNITYVKATESPEVDEFVNTKCVPVEIHSLTDLNKFVDSIKGNIKITYPKVTNKDVLQLYNECVDGLLDNRG